MSMTGRNDSKRRSFDRSIVRQFKLPDSARFFLFVCFFLFYKVPLKQSEFFHCPQFLQGLLCESDNN